MAGVVLLLAVLFTFVFQNPAAVEIHFITWSSPQVSLAVVVLTAALGGVLATFLLDTVRYFRIARTIKELRHDNRMLKGQILALQTEKERLKKELAERVQT